MSEGLIDVVIPALNEQTTIGRIISTFRSHPRIGKIIVMIDEKTEDFTATTAIEAGAITFFPNVMGKGQLVMEGLLRVSTSLVITSDADYTKFSGYAVHLLVETAREHEMTILIPKPPTQHEWETKGLDIPFNHDAWAWNSGLRVFPTDILTGVSQEGLHGYLMETQLNQAARKKGYQITRIGISGVHSPLRFTERRIKALEDDRQWGLDNGVFES